jgi:pimeloyl-ACP methyl ester carboxylesterase
MATFVLVTPLLTNHGHKVYTPTLTGLGERSHLLREDIDLNTHILDIIKVFEYEDLDDLILVGHSYGGRFVEVDCYCEWLEKALLVVNKA